MELDDIKNKWKKMDEFSEQNTPIDRQQLQKITKTSYSKNMLKIVIPEIIFSLIYLYWLVFFINFNEYFVNNTQKFLSYLAIVLLIVLPVLNLSSVFQFYKTGKLFDSYHETIKLFYKQSKRFNKFKYSIVTLNIILLLICVILVPLVYSEHLTKTEITISFIIGSVFALWFSVKIWKYYRKQIQRNEELIKKLE